MNPFVRRSHLLVPVLDCAAVADSWRHNADAVILDLSSAHPRADRAAARELLPESIRAAGKGGAEVFALIDPATIHADIASATLGIAGVVCPIRVGADVDVVASALSEMERDCGIPHGELRIIALLDSAVGVWNIREIVRSSPRVCSVGIDELRLCADMGIVPNIEFDPFEYAKGRVIIEARAAHVQPVGMSHPYGVLPRFDDDADIYRLALRSKNLGFAGAICPHPSWVSHCNRAFAPDEDKLEFYRETRRLFAEGIARGTAAVPYPGTTMMIDVPVDENARVALELWELCAEREAQKAEALAEAVQ